MQITRRSMIGFLTGLPFLPGLSLRGVVTGKVSSFVPGFLHPNDRWVAVRSDRGFLYEILDLETGRHIQTLLGSDCDTYYGQPRIFFEPGGRFLLQAYEGVHEGHLLCWDLESPGSDPQVLPVLRDSRDRSENTILGVEPEESWRGWLPRFTLPQPGGLLRFPHSDWDLHTWKCVARRKVALSFRLLIPETKPEDDGLSIGRRRWKILEPREAQVQTVVGSPDVRLRIASLPLLWRPSETRGGTPTCFAKRGGDGLLIQSGWCTVRELDGQSGKLRRIVSGTMPQTGLLAFGSSRNTVFAARPLGEAVRWNRLGRSTKVKGGIEDELIRPPIQELGERVEAAKAPGEFDRFSDGVRTLAWDPRGLALGLDNGTILIGAQLDRNGGPWRRLEGHSEAVRALVFLPGVMRLISGGREGNVRLWDLENGKLVKQLGTHEARVNAAVAGTLQAATGGPDGVRIWNLPDASLQRHLSTNGVWVSDLALSPDGGLLVGALMDGNLRAWDMASGEVRWEADGEAGWCAALAFDPRGIWIASGHEDGSIRLWDVKNGKALRRRCVEGQTSWQQGILPVHALAWSHDGQALCAAFGDAVRIYDRDLKSGTDEGWVLPLDWADEYT